MEPINILYIDDKLDPYLSQYLDKYAKKNRLYMINYDEEEYDPQKGYEYLLENEKVKHANIIVIDSYLFDNQNASSGKLTGEEFKLIVKRKLPFIETIVITQNDIDSKFNAVKKFLSSRDTETDTYSDYYDNYLKNKLEEAISNIVEYRAIEEKLQKNKEVDAVTGERIKNSLQGVNIYDDLSKTDIDTLIQAFQNVQEKINGQ